MGFCPRPVRARIAAPGWTRHIWRFAYKAIAKRAAPLSQFRYHMDLGQGVLMAREHNAAVDPVDEILPPLRMATLGLQHVLVMYAGAVAVPLIVGRALNLAPEDVAFLISADLFCCGIATIIQSLGVTRWFGIQLPVMMGVTFASVGPMIAMANAYPGPDGARMIFGAIIGAGIIAMLIAPLIGRMLKFFPPLVTGTIILVIGVTLMRVGINWIFGNPVGPTAPRVVDPVATGWLNQLKDLAGTGVVSALPEGFAPAASVQNPLYARPVNIAISGVVLVAILLIARFGRGFVANIAVLLGMLIGAALTIVLGQMTFEKVAEAALVRHRHPLSLRRADL